MLNATNEALRVTRTVLGQFDYIKKQLKAMDTVKTMGPDNIPTLAQKTCAPELAVPLGKLFQYRYHTGIYLAKSKTVLVYHVPQKQVKSKPANYCSKCTLIISKVMEGVVNAAIKW
eukprot:g23282.t1